MRRFLISLAAVVPLAGGFAVAEASATANIAPRDATTGTTTTTTTTPTTTTAKVRGTIVSVDASAGTFVADAYIASSGGEYFGGHPGLTPGAYTGPGAGSGGPGGPSSTGGMGGGPGFAGGTPATMRADFHPGDHPAEGGASSGGDDVPSQVTITTNASTTITADGSTVAFSSLTAGEHFVASFTGSDTDSLSTLVANPALSVGVGLDRGACAPAQRTLYAFAGTVTGTDTTADTVTVTLAASTPRGLITGSSATFTVGLDTTIFGADSAGTVTTLAGIRVGDTVAGGLFGPSDLTAAQFEAAPLAALIDIPQSAGSSTTSSERKAHRRRRSSRPRR